MLFAALPSRRFAAMNASTSRGPTRSSGLPPKNGPRWTRRYDWYSPSVDRLRPSDPRCSISLSPASSTVTARSIGVARSRSIARWSPRSAWLRVRPLRDAGLALSPELACDPTPADPPLPVPAFQPASIPSNRERPGASRASRHVPDRPTRLRQLNRCDLHTRFGSSGPRVRRGPKDDRWSDPPSRLHSVGMLGQARSHPARSATPGRRRGRCCGHPDVPAQQASGRSGTRRRASAGDAGTGRAPCGGRGSRPRLGRG